MPASHPYPTLDDFVGGYLHQDWTLESDNLEGVVAHYLADGGDAEGRALRADIARLVADHPDRLDHWLTFQLGEGVAYASGWEMTAAQWLAYLDRLLAQHLGD